MDNSFEMLFGRFVNDKFNWKNSRHSLFSADPVIMLQRKKEFLFWTPDEIKEPYTMNSMAYRSDEFAETRDIVFAGCSQTWGCGVVYDGIWGNILSKSLDKKSYNLGIASKGTQFIVNNTIAFCKKYGNPKAIFCLFPEFTRIEMMSDAAFMKGMFTDNNAIGRHQYNMIPNKRNPEKNVRYSKAPHLAEDMIPSEFLFSINLDYIHMLEMYCELNNIKLFWGTWDPWQDNYLHNNIDATDFKNYVYLGQGKWDTPPGSKNEEFYGDDETYTNYKKCHEEYREKYGRNFDFAMDTNPKNGEGHMAVHKHIHIAEKFEEAFKNAGN
jgi:hypothetical protein